MSHPPGSRWGCPAATRQVPSMHCREQGTHTCPDYSLAFSVQCKTVFGSTRSPAQPAKMPQPSPGGAISIDESVVSLPRVFRNLAVALSTKAPSTTPAGVVGNQQSWPESCSEPTGYHTSTSLERAVTVQHSQIETDDVKSTAFIQLFSYPSHTFPSVSSKNTL